MFKSCIKQEELNRNEGKVNNRIGAELNYKWVTCRSQECHLLGPHSLLETLKGNKLHCTVGMAWGKVEK